MSKVPDKQVMSDLDATVAWAKKSGKGNTDKLHHRLLLGRTEVGLYSAHNPNVKAGVAWYGRPGKPETASNRIDMVESLKAPCSAYGEADTGIPKESVEQMQALKDAKKPGESFCTRHAAPSSPTIGRATARRMRKTVER